MNSKFSKIEDLNYESEEMIEKVKGPYLSPTAFLDKINSMQPDVSEEDLDKNKQDREGADYGITLVDTVVNSLIKKLPELPYNPVPEDWDKKQEYLKAQLINSWFTKFGSPRPMPSSIIKEYEALEHYIERFKTIVIVGVFEYLTKSNREMFTIGRINLSDFYSLSFDLVGYEIKFLISVMDKFHDEIHYMNKELKECSKKKSPEFVNSARKICLEFINSLEF